MVYVRSSTWRRDVSGQLIVHLQPDSNSFLRSDLVFFHGDAEVREKFRIGGRRSVTLPKGLGQEPHCCSPSAGHRRHAIVDLRV